MLSLWRDIRFSVRLLAKNKAFTIVSVLTLALGIGANTAIFSVMNAVVLRYMPVPEPGRLVYLHTTGWPNGASQTGDGSLSFTLHTFDQLRGQRDVFSDVMAFVPLAIGKVAVRYGQDAEEARANMVSGSFFSGLGVRPELGQIFAPEDESRHSLVAVLSHAYWTVRFGRDPSVLGQPIYVKGVPFTIVGVAAAEFHGVDPAGATDLWVPLQNRPDLTAWGNSAEGGTTLYGSHPWWCLMMVGRLGPGMTAQQAVARLTPVFQRAAYDGIGTRDPKEQPPQLYFTEARGIGTRREELAGPLAILMAMVGLVLVIACGNVALLLVARNSVREREFSLRMALGAARTQLFRQLLTESLLLVAGGGGLGWLFASWVTRALAAWSELGLSLAPDRKVLGFTLVVSFLAALVFGLAPLRSVVRIPVGLALKTSAATAHQDRRKVRSGQLVVGFQISLCLVLLVGAGLLVRSLRNLETVGLGLRVSGLVVFGITPPVAARTDADARAFFVSLLGRFRALPGVESVTLMSNRIGSGWSNNTSAWVDGANPRGTAPSGMRWNAVGPDYFRVLGTSLVLGRDFNDSDTAGGPKVVIVNQTFAERYLAGRSPLGHHVALSPDKNDIQFTIVGVAADSKYTGVRERSVPMAYFPYTQIPGTGTMHFELRTRGSAEALLPAVRRAVREMGPDLPLLQPMTQDAQFRASFSQERLFARLALFFGLLAALLVATGLYGTLAYRASRRTVEIGVRMALGAPRGEVLWLVLRETLLVAAAGLVVGLPAAVAAGRLLRSMLFGLAPGDTTTYAGAVVAIVLVVLAASLIPARRAASVDPIAALRQE